MYPVSADFHNLSIADAPTSRVRIYFIEANVDCTDDNDVQSNGTLLCMPGETDSNGRIEKGGVTINEFFNSDTNVQIGATVSSQIGMTLINRDGALDGFNYGRCKVYIDVYDDTNSTWLTCPMGVYNIAIPKRRKVQLVSATGYDQMQQLDEIADSWWNGLDWSNGITLLQIIQSMTATLGIYLSANTSANIVNSGLSYTEIPFTSIEMTYRDILSYIAETTGTIARFDRNGALDLRWFAAAQISGNTVTVNTDTVGNQCLSIDVGEYQVSQIDALSVKASQADVGVTIGSGGNAYTILDNPMLFGDEAAITTKATPIYNRLSAFRLFTPISMRCIMDWSIEAGDIITVTNESVTYDLPIFQQRLRWRGGYVVSDLFSNGEQERPTQSKEIRSSFRSNTQMHEFEVTLEQLRSYIQSVDGNYTLIQQTVDAITQTVANQNVTIQNILDPTGEIWTAITKNTSNLSSIEDSLNNEITERRSYIRFIPSEPAIVMGVDEDNEIKLKLVNNIIYFFNGADDSTDLSLAYAYFNSQEAFADRFVAGESVQIGTNDNAAHWLWKELNNGDLVLELVG